MASEGGSSGGSDLFLLFGIFLLFFLVWLAGGGPERPISFAGPFLNPITQTGTTAQPYGSMNAYQHLGTGISIGGWGASISTGGGAGGPAQVSASAGSVSFARDPSGAKATRASQEYVTVTASPLNQSAVSTAGWRLVSERTGQGAAFPYGAEILRSGRVNELAPITLRPGETAIVISGSSPVGVSFRENLCAGYLEERQDFRPPLPLSCPTPYQEYLRVEGAPDDECAAYLRSLPFCSAVPNPSRDVSSSCRAFAEGSLSYNSCVDGHSGRQGFHGMTWRVFLGSRDELWRQENETILLQDAQGRTIDSFSY